MDTDPRTGLHSMWRTGGGKAGYEELRQPEIAEDPLLRLFARCDEIEDSKGKGVVDTAGRRIVCDADRGNSLSTLTRVLSNVVGTARRVPTPRPPSLHHSRGDGWLAQKINEDDGRRCVAYGVWEGVQPINKHNSAALLEEAGILETRDRLRHPPTSRRWDLRRSSPTFMGNDRL